ncbi:MAG TPA: hypothetical protein PK413_11270, partial [Thermoanaerobaculia bacterium]|nr:hypothetical protein [Thermoanaerobaculia bacterium]
VDLGLRPAGEPQLFGRPPQGRFQAEVEVASLLLIGSADRIYPMGMRMLEQWLQLIDVAGIEATLAEIAFWNFSAASFEKVPDLLQRFVRGGLASFGDTEIFKHQMRLCHAYSTRPPLERITAPTLVARGELDFFYPQFCSQALADAIPGSRMVEIAQTAHAVLWENPEAVARLACEFVGELEREP